MINTVTLHGRLVADPELRYTTNGTAVASGNIAVTDGYGDNEKTYFFNYEVWRHNAEYMGKYAKKGMPVTISGKLTQQTWQNQNGENRSKVVVSVLEVVLPPKSGGSMLDGEEVIDFDATDLPF
jgi:single-strand DNA-binding protein